MCGRYTLVRGGAEMAAHFDVEGAVADARRYNVTPGQEAPVVRAAGGGRAISALRWGLLPFWAKAGMRPMINARAETAAEKPAFRTALRLRRCLVAADGFYEWRGAGPRREPWHFRLAGGGIAAFAGLWERRADEGGADEAFAILTTSANAVVAPVHDRMPVIVAPEDFGLWLDADLRDPARLAPLLAPFPADRMEARAVSRRVNDARFDGPECLEASLEPNGPSATIAP